MREITFTVAGLPPKKDGANSMWRKNPEVARLIALRLAAGQLPLARDIRLELVVHVARNDRSIDLDNMVSGVLDALQRCHDNTPWNSEPRWLAPDAEHVRPDQWAAITDDVEVVEIRARKLIGDVVAGEERYEIGLSG